MMHSIGANQNFQRALGGGFDPVTMTPDTPVGNPRWIGLVWASVAAQRKIGVSSRPGRESRLPSRCATLNREERLLRGSGLVVSKRGVSVDGSIENLLAARDLVGLHQPAARRL